MNIFELATRQKLRFPSVKGDLNIEQLWDLPLTVQSGQFDLDSVAQAVNTRLKAVSESSFVAIKAHPAKAGLELSLEIVKHIIAVKMQQAEDNQKANQKAILRRQLVEALGQKRNEEIGALSVAELEKQIAELG